MSAFITFKVRANSLNAADEIRDILEQACEHIAGIELRDERCENVAGDSCSEWDMPQSVN